MRTPQPTLFSHSREGSAVLTESGMVPGQSQPGVIDIHNASSMDATFALAQSNVTGTVLAGSPSLSIFAAE
jgi:hypothetical protein